MNSTSTADKKKPWLRGISMLFVDEQIKILYKKMRDREVAEVLGVPFWTVRNARIRLGLKKGRGKIRSDRPDTEAEMERVQKESEVYFFKCHTKLSARQIAKRVNRSRRWVEMVVAGMPKNWAKFYDMSKEEA